MPENLSANGIVIPPDEIHLDFIQAAGPGGQNVNKTATAVQLRFDVRNSASLPEDVRLRLIRLAGKRINLKGELVIVARRYRTQEKNRLDAEQRLETLLRMAAEKPKDRRKTKPTLQSQQRRLEAKRLHSQKKRLRSRPSSEGMP